MSVSPAKYVFGPIHSRRLGRSLGVNLLPYKTCTMNCIYCECGATTDLTVERKAFFPLRDVLAQIDEALEKDPAIDFLTFSGSGEPTLHPGVGAIVRHVHEKFPRIRVCLLTNSTFLGDPVLRNELRELDLIVPSLDGSNEEEFERIDRPHPDVTFASVMEALIAFRKDCPNVPMWLEIFIVPGVNDSPASVERFVSAIRRIGPDKVQLNSLDRAGAVDWIRVPSEEDLDRMAQAFSAAAPVEIVRRIRREGNAV